MCPTNRYSAAPGQRKTRLEPGLRGVLCLFGGQWGWNVNIIQKQRRHRRRVRREVPLRERPGDDSGIERAANRLPYVVH